MPGFNNDVVLADRGEIGITPSTGTPDFSVQKSRQSAPVTQHISNDGTNSGSGALLDMKVSGTSGGNPEVRYTIPSGTSWRTGVDNANSDRFFLGTGTSPGSSNALFGYPDFSLVFNGGVAYKVEAGTGVINLADNDYILAANTGSGAVTVNLPTAPRTQGTTYRILDLSGNASVNNITINAGGGNNINGSASLVLSNNFEAVDLIWTDLTGRWLVASSFITSVGPSGTMVQQIVSESATQSSTTGIIPQDNTIPQQTEGIELLTATITPTNASNRLVITAHLNLASSSSTLNVALFQDATADSIRVVAAGSAPDTKGSSAILLHIMTAGTTSSTTFKIRAGVPAGISSIFFNQLTNPAATFGNTMSSYILIEEIVP